MNRAAHRTRGVSTILALFTVLLFSVLAISLTATSNVNLQTSLNHRNVGIAQAAAESGLEYAGYLVASYSPPAGAYSPNNSVSQSEAVQTVGFFADHVQTLLAGAPLLAGQGIAWDSGNTVMDIPASGQIAFGADSSGHFSLRLEFLPGDGSSDHLLLITSTGIAGAVARQTQLSYPIRKDGKVLEYAIASRGRMWVTGDSTIHGDIFSSWDRAEISPFNVTADSSVLGTINTVLTQEQIAADHSPYADYQLETLDGDGQPMFDGEGNRIYSEDDEVQGYHEGINYGQPFDDMPGMSIDDYDTDGYNVGLTDISSCPTSDRETEYFPHAAGNYNQPSSSSSRQLIRHVYENQTFTDARLPDNRNALFRNCTFEGTLYIDCYKSGSTNYNNVRFENCGFNGPIITDVPEVLRWKENCLYFTGAATFSNQAMEEATILAPHFNVNLGNTNPVGTDNSELTGAIVGGIVDVRGNAVVRGTIISMCDTTQWSGGYVTNIGCTIYDGGSETTEPGDIGTIDITPQPDKLLPSGIRTPIIISESGRSYTEI